MVSGPAPRLIIHPRPAIRRNPTPVPVTVWRPVHVLTSSILIRPPNVAIFLCVDPLTKIVQIFGTIDVAVIIPIVIRVLHAFSDGVVAV